MAASVLVSSPTTSSLTAFLRRERGGREGGRREGRRREEGREAGRKRERGKEKKVGWSEEGKEGGRKREREEGGRERAIPQIILFTVLRLSGNTQLVIFDELSPRGSEHIYIH